MSPNNLVLVIHAEGRSYVAADVDADECWSAEWARAYVEGHPLSRWRSRWRSRAAALVRAHDLQNRLRTEYGVREIFLQ